MLHRSQQTLTLSLQWGPWRAEASPRLAPAPITHSQLPQPSRMDPHFQLTHRFGSIALPVCTSCGSTVCTPKHYSRKSEETGRLEDEEVGGCSRGKPQPAGQPAQPGSSPAHVCPPGPEAGPHIPQVLEAISFSLKGGQSTLSLKLDHVLCPPTCPLTVQSPACRLPSQRMQARAGLLGLMAPAQLAQPLLLPHSSD